MNQFLKEILEQPQAIENVLSFYSGNQADKLLKNISNGIKEKKIEQILFTGMGSSYFISHAACSLFNNLDIDATYVNASELLHYNFSLLNRSTLLICLSQSGESFEVKEILQKMPSTVFCVGITNEEESTLALSADIALLCKGGKEEMTSTKTYVLSSLVAFILGWHLNNTWNEEKIKKVQRLQQNFSSSLKSYDSWLQKALDFLGDISTVQVIARGPSFSTASQSALMFKEATHIAATGILGGEFRHGPMEMVKEGFKAILFAAKGKTFTQSIKMAEDIAEFGGKVLLITNEKIVAANEKIMQIHIDEADEYLFSIQSIIPVQLFIDAYAKEKGYTAGSFSRGAKVTMIE